MTMERWNPFRETDSMRQFMDRWFDDRFPSNPAGGTSGQSLSVAVDLTESENGYDLTASLPGVKPEDLDITVNRDTITIRGKSEGTSERQQGNFIYRERHSGSFQRSVRLPEPVDSEKVQANLDHGILKLHLPRLQQTGSRRIQVSGGAGHSQVGQTGATTTQTVHTGAANVPNNPTGQTDATASQPS